MRFPILFFILGNNTKNELKFCGAFTQKHPMKCIGGRFFDYDGLVDENALGNEVYRMLRQGVWIGLSKKVVQIMDALRLYTYSAPVTPDLNFIHVQNGKLDDVLLDGDTFRSYLQAKPLDRLNKRIAAINQAEIQDAPLIRYLRVLKALQCNTLGDVSRLIQTYEEDAYRLARHQLGNTDIDIVSSAIGLQNICIVCILKTGGGKIGLERLFEVLNGNNSQNASIAEMTYQQARNIELI